MKLIFIYVLIIFHKVESCLSETTKNYKDLDNSILLRKLQNLQNQNQEENTRVITWSEMLAEVLVNHIKIFTFNNQDYNEVQNDPKPVSQNIFTKMFSDVLEFYKRYVYDKWIYKRHVNNVENSDTNKHPVTDNKSLNDDVEIIEPVYHGKLCKNCEEGLTTEIDLKNCPKGYIIDAKGNCADPKSSNFIFSIPFQCPNGYRRDWLGYCRISL